MINIIYYSVYTYIIISFSRTEALHKPSVSGALLFPGLLEFHVHLYEVLNLVFKVLHM